MDGLKRLFREARRRSVWKVFGIYLAGGWVALQVVDTLAGALDLPPWAPRLALFMLIIGLPIVVATAVAQAGRDGTAERGASGSDVPADDDHRAQGAGAVSAWLTWRNAIGGGVLAFAVWGVVAAGWMLWGRDPTPPGTTVDGRGPSVAVLPFDNRSAEPGSEFFVDGVHDDILTQLSKIGGLRVISRSSVIQYRGSEKTIPAIAGELGVSAILEGGVQRSGSGVRVNVQLIDGVTDDHLWAETFDRALTAENVFSIQSEIATQVAGALRVQLTSAERAQIDVVPTASDEAYDEYLRGLAQNRRPTSEESTTAAIAHFARAIDLDPGFALAYAALSEAHTTMHWYWWDRSAGRLQMGKDAVDRALELEPDLPEGRQALGMYHYRGSLDYPRAMAELAAARAGRPGDAGVLINIGSAQRRMGDIEGSLGTYDEAVALDPNNANLLWQIGVSLTWLRRWDDAVRAFERAIAADSEATAAYVMKARALVSGSRLEEAREFAEAWPGYVGPAAILERNTSGAEALLRVVYTEPSGALARLDEEADRVPPALYHLVSAELLARTGSVDSAVARYDAAREILDDLSVERPGDWRWRSERALALAGLGEAEAASAEGLAAVELMSSEVDALDSADPPVYLAQVLVMVGEYDRAVDLLEDVLARPGWLSASWLEVDPVWAPLRDHPRYRDLLTPH
jgi:TolB-like protein/Flp pilus assembly protein TadD